MASKKSTTSRSSKKTTKKVAKRAAHYPVVLGTELLDAAPATATTKLLQVDRELSKSNHRLYRMCRYYEVKLDLHPNSGDAQVDVYALADTWALQQAVKMAWNVYQENTKEERQLLSNSQKARWGDFRVAHGLSIAFDEVVAARRSTGLGATPFTVGEFELTKVVDTAGTTRTFTLGPSTATEYGILTSYDASANAQQTPDSIPTGPYAGLNPNIDTANFTNLQDDGNLPPYNQTSLAPSQMWVRIGQLSAGPTGVQRLSTGYFTAPMGLVVLQSVETANNVQFTVKSGDYKGVHAPSMME